MSETSSSISERIRALEGAGITDVFVKKRVPSYAAQAAQIGESIQQTQTIISTKTTKIYQNPANFIHTQSSSSLNSSLSSPPSNPQLNNIIPDIIYHKSPSRSSSRNELNQSFNHSNRTASIDSIENELNPILDYRVTNLADDLVGVKKTLRRVSVNRDEFDYNLNTSTRPSMDLNPDEISIQVPINIPLEKRSRSASGSSNNSVFRKDSLRPQSNLENLSNINMFSPIDSKKNSLSSERTVIKNDTQDLSSRKSSNASTIKAPLSHSSSNISSLNNSTLNLNENLNNNNNHNHNRLLIFNGETKGMSQSIHSDHFACWQCDASLTGSRYILKDEHPYCIKCYEELFAHECEECHKKIGTDSKDLSYKDKHWHEKCFFCHVCKLPLVDKPFGSKNDSLYCGECYNQAFASRCDKCAQIFKPGMKKMEYKGQQFHETCFLCNSCNSAIGTKSFIPKDNRIFCVPCYENQFATKCTECMKVISQGGVSYKNQPYHKECFTCTHCQQSLAGQRFTSREDHPYCSECFGKLFAKKCFACHKPITGIGGTKYISFEDRHWHNDCFECNRCHTSLVGRGFLTDAMDILCPDCGKNEP